MQRTCKTLVALAAVLALLSFSAAPSSATTGNITAGSLSVNLIPPLSSSLVPGTGPCPGAPATTLSATSTSSTSANLSLNIPGSAFTYSGATYFLVGSANGTATLSGSSISANLSVSGAQIYRESTPGSCTAGTVAVCGPSGINVANLPLSGTFSGSFSPPNVTGTASGLGGTSTPISALGCKAPFATLNTKQITITGLNATF